LNDFWIPKIENWNPYSKKSSFGIQKSRKIKTFPFFEIYMKNAPRLPNMRFLPRLVMNAEEAG
jgi:hypothetical protein